MCQNKEENPLPDTDDHSEKVDKLKPVQEIMSEEIVNDRYEVKKLSKEAKVTCYYI